MPYYLHYDKQTGQVIGAPYHDAVHDLKSIPSPYIALNDAEHNDWMQHQSTLKVNLATLKLVEYTPPGPSAEEIKQQQFKSINATYSRKLNCILSAINHAQARGDTRSVSILQITYNSTQDAWKTALQAVMNPVS